MPALHTPRLSKFLATAMAALLLAPTSVLANETGESHSLTVFPTYKAAASSSNGRLLHIDMRANLSSGYSGSLFDERKKAVAAAEKRARNTRSRYFLVFRDGRQNFPASKPPPGKLMGGIYYVYQLLPIDYIELTPGNLLAEIKSHLQVSFELSREHVLNLFEVARNDKHKSLIKEYKKIVRDNNKETLANDALPQLVPLIASLEGKASANDIMKWAKYHKNPGVRVAAYTTLVELGKVQDVEKMLQNEKNQKVKEMVEQKLI